MVLSFSDTCQYLETVLFERGHRRGYETLWVRTRGTTNILQCTDQATHLSANNSEPPRPRMSIVPTLKILATWKITAWSVRKASPLCMACCQVAYPDSHRTGLGGGSVYSRTGTPRRKWYVALWGALIPALMWYLPQEDKKVLLSWQDVNDADYMEAFVS